MNDLNTFFFHFRYRFKNGSTKNVILHVDKTTLNLIASKKRARPQWTELSYLQCPHCPLHQEEHPCCPIALHLVDIISDFKDARSHEEVDVFIKTEARTFMKRTTLQKGLSSLIGICMVTSGCPVMDKLKPMVRYHLPFATSEEMRYRVITMYLFAQYALYKREKKPDWELQGLLKLYQDIKILNKYISQRLAHINIEDASLNALAILDLFAESLTFSIDKDDLDDIEVFFSAYF